MKSNNITIFKLLAIFIIIFCNQSIALSLDTDLNNDTSDEIEGKAFHRLYIGLNGGFSQASFKTENATTSKWEVNNLFNLIPSIDISYQITNSIGAGIGFRLGKYASNYKIEGFNTQLKRSFLDVFDNDKDMYFPIYEDLDLVENTIYSALEIPLFLSYRNTIGSGKLGYFANLGVLLTSFFNPEFTLSGTMTRKGYYPDFNAVLNDYPEYKFDNLEYSEANSIELGAPKMMVSGYLSAGAMYSVTSDILVKVGISGTYGFTKVEPVVEDSFSDFHSSLILGSSSITSVGLEIGVVYKLFNK